MAYKLLLVQKGRGNMKALIVSDIHANIVALEEIWKREKGGGVPSNCPTSCRVGSMLGQFLLWPLSFV
ncbi:hypothetical protein GCM10010911_54060 [Paenibacillus nasutitermitis]|uniref:Uncharacterized protein n=1 Tax=Paenibacillus nasutitermitis TaxID=1652958 RepID=A0A917E0C9_9BACL|nr:hypothetical protein GCM10010911_54060 [Paenibacillus nasutitermitis]